MINEFILSSVRAVIEKDDETMKFYGIKSQCQIQLEVINEERAIRVYTEDFTICVVSI